MMRVRVGCGVRWVEAEVAVTIKRKMEYGGQRAWQGWR